MNKKDSLEERVMGDFSVSDWLKREIVESRERDICDMMSDVGLLGEVLKERWERLVKSEVGR